MGYKLPDNFERYIAGYECCYDYMTEDKKLQISSSGN